MLSRSAVVICIIFETASKYRLYTSSGLSIYKAYSNFSTQYHKLNMAAPGSTNNADAALPATQQPQALTMEDIIVHPELMFFTADTVSLINTPREDRDDKCLICMNPMLRGEHLLLHLGTCGNAFHKHCLMEWLKTHYTCVACRAEIMPTTSNVALVALQGVIDRNFPRYMTDIDEWLRKLRITAWHQFETQMTFIARTGRSLDLTKAREGWWGVLEVLDRVDPFFAFGTTRLLADTSVINTANATHRAQAGVDVLMHNFEQAMTSHRRLHANNTEENQTEAAFHLKLVNEAFALLLHCGYGELGMYDHTTDRRYRPGDEELRPALRELAGFTFQQPIPMYPGYTVYRPVDPQSPTNNPTSPVHSQPPSPRNSPTNNPTSLNNPRQAPPIGSPLLDPNSPDHSPSDSRPMSLTNSPTNNPTSLNNPRQAPPTGTPPLDPNSPTHNPTSPENSRPASPTGSPPNPRQTRYQTRARGLRAAHRARIARLRGGRDN